MRNSINKADPMIDYKNEKRNRGLFQICSIIVVCILILSFFIHPVGATIPINVTSLGQTYITWGWSQQALTSISVDGNTISTVNLNTNTYTLSKLNPSEVHTIQIYTLTDNGFNQTQTLPANTDSMQLLSAFILTYLWWIIAAILLVFAATSKNSMLGMISAISCLIGMIKGIADHTFLVFLLYIITFICAYWITESNLEG